MITRASLTAMLACIAGLISATSASGEPWRRHTIDAGSSGADGIRLADANGDGLLDAAVGWEEGGVVRVYLNPGPGACRARWPAVTVGEVPSSEDAVLVDLDSDGAVDVVSCSEGDERQVFVHWAPREPARYLDASAWRSESFAVTHGVQWMFAAPLDVDGSRGVDLVIGSKGAGASVNWLQSPEDPRRTDAWRLHRLAEAGWIMSLRTLDVNGDGADDVLVSDRHGPTRGVYYLDRQAPGEFVRRPIGGADHECLFLDHGDLDGDGGLDVLVATKQRRALWFHGPNWGPTAIVGEINKAVRIGDLNLDGRPDLAFTCERGGRPEVLGVGWISGDDAAEDEPKLRDIAGSQGTKFDRIELLDLDADGDLDLLTCEENAGADSRGLGVIWYENPTR